MKPPANRPDLGKKGELAARSYLDNLGYRFLDSNFKTRYGEIDLIYLDGNVLVLVEVKARNKNPFQDMEKTIGKIKINRILKSAEIYIGRTETEFGEIRIDAVFVEFSGDSGTVRHLKNFH